MRTLMDVFIAMGQTQDKHCTRCSWAGYTGRNTCPKCGGDLDDD